MGLYSIYVEDWLDVYRREQFYFVQLEEFSESPEEHTNKIFEFLDIGKLYVIWNIVALSHWWYNLFLFEYPILPAEPLGTDVNKITTKM